MDTAMMDAEELYAAVTEYFPGTVGEVADVERKGKRARRGRGRWIGWIAQQVRYKMGPLPEDNKANRALAWEHARLLLENKQHRDNRPTNTGHQLAMVVEAVFVPTVHDVEAARFRRSTVVKDRLSEVSPSRFRPATVLFVVFGVSVLLIALSLL
jgi:hypothetical protein